MDPSIPPHLENSYRECQALAFGHYENFPVASLLLSKELRPHVAALYAFARTADDFADEPPPPALLRNRAALSPDLSPGVLTKGEAKRIAKGGETIKKWRLMEIDRWEKGLKNALKGKDAPAPLQAFAHTLRAFGIPLTLPLALLRAFRMDVSLHRYSTWNSLLYYCRHSANPVGRMVLLLHGIREEKLHRYSDFICSGLQLINFWQDSSIDIERGRVYYPKSEWRKAGARERDLLARRDSPAARLLVKNAVAFTETHFRKGFPLLKAVPGRLGLELRATCRGGLVILEKIRAMDHRVLEERPSLSAFDKASIGLRSLLPGELP
jgi:hydroxysqualene synthase